MDSIKNIVPPEFLKPSQGFSEAMNSMDINWWYYDVVNKQLLVSPGLREILGYSLEDFDPADPTPDKNLHPEDRKKNRETFNDFIAGKSQIYEMEYRVYHHGVWRWLYNRGTVFHKDERGNTLFAGGITLDISNRFSNMMTRLEEGSKFEFIFRNTTQPVLVITMGEENDPGEILEMNDAANELFGAAPGELIGKNPYELIDMSFRENRDELRKALMEDGHLQLDLQFTDQKGNIRYLDVRSHIFSFTDQNLFISIIDDKTETQKVRKELAASELALRQSEKVYRSLIMAANDRIGLFETNGTPVVINKAFYETLGFTEEEFMGLEDKERVHPEDIEQLKQLSDQFFQTGSLSTEYRVMHKDGYYIHMNSRSVLLQDSELEKDYILFIIRDVTSRVEVRKKLIEAKEKAEESDQLKSAFLANMSHEIRTPMNSIVGFANLLSEEDIDEPTRTEFADRINRNSEQLLALISDIIDLAKIESSQLSIVYTIVYLDNLFSELMQYGITQLGQRMKSEVILKYDPDPDHTSFQIETDLIRLTQVLQNLLNNAIKFTSKGEVYIGYRVQQDKVLFFVKDTGIGIESKNFDIIFDQFRQVDGSRVRNYGGTGLGLAICKNLVTLLKGKIWVDSEPGEGSTFNVQLPVLTGYDIRESGEKLQKVSPPKRDITVLIADDDPDSLLLLKALLRNEGVKTITTDSGYGALELLEREDQPDLVMLDLQMPVLSGEQTLRIIREKYRDLKVIAQSARAFESERVQMINTGFDGYISKPYSKENLLEIIYSVLAD